MKTLTFIRHAKSSWKYNLPDKERPLKTRGIADAQKVSFKFKNINPSIDIIFCSPAKRASSTCKIFLKNFEFDSKRNNITDDLYDFSGNKVERFITNINDEYDNVLIFGHNDAFNRLINKLGNKSIPHLPTCGLVKIVFNIDSWKNVREGGKTELIIFPRHLKNK